MSEVKNLVIAKREDLVAVADAIRDVTGITEKLSLSMMQHEIYGITEGESCVIYIENNVEQILTIICTGPSKTQACHHLRNNEDVGFMALKDSYIVILNNTGDEKLIIESSENENYVVENNVIYVSVDGTFTINV